MTVRNVSSSPQPAQSADRSSVISDRPTLADWAVALQPAQEFASTPLVLLSGQVPAALRGTLYRNGPGRLGRGDQPVGHWFDGDGAVLRIYLGDQPTATYRYVKTKGFLAEEQAGRLLFGNYGMTAPGPIWNQWVRSLKNSANTSVLALPDRLLSLWEGEPPHALDLNTLETLGSDRLGCLAPKSGYSAHPKVDAHTGEIFNFGLSIGPRITLNLYRSSRHAVGSDRPGTIQHHQAHPLSSVPLVHDFVLAGPYLIFLLPPVRLRLWPVLLGTHSFSDALSWQPQRGTEILIFHRDTLQLVSRGTTDPWFQWHVNNGHLDDRGRIVLSLIRYADFSTNQYLKEIATGAPTTPTKGTLWQYTINPTTATVEAAQELISRGCEFPVVDAADVGRSQPFSYLSIHRKDAVLPRDLFGGVARFDHQTQTLHTYEWGAGWYPSEPIVVPHPEDAERGWLLSVVLNTHDRISELWIFDRERLEDGAIARLGLPQMIPPSFHGTWYGNC